MSYPRIVGGDGTVLSGALDDVRKALEGFGEVILGAHAAGAYGESIHDGATIYNMEPLYDGCRSFMLGYLDTLRRCKVIDYQAENVAYLRSRGISALHMPYRYHPSLEREIPEVEQDIDVLLIGSFSPRRLAILNQLRDAGVKVTVVDGVYGEERDALIGRAKIHLNIHYADHHPLEVVRLNYLIANRCFVISEPGWDDEENLAYSKCLAYACVDQIADTCKRFLADGAEDARMEIASAGQAALRAMPMDTSVISRNAPNVFMVASGVDIAPLVHEIECNPQLWNELNQRTESPSSPHYGLSDIWVRYTDGEQADIEMPHDSVWYPPVHLLTHAKRIALEVMAMVGGERLGGVLITKIPPGVMCKRHNDRGGWHSAYYDKYAVQLKSNEAQAFHFDGESLSARPGDVYWFNNQVDHWVTNDSSEDRITMIVCIRSERHRKEG